MRFIGTLFAKLAAFWIALKTYGRSQKKLGTATERMEQQADTLEGLEDAKRIKDQINKDLAALDPDERERLLRDRFTRH